jgi:hypothetical protein
MLEKIAIDVAKSVVVTLTVDGIKQIFKKEDK